MAAVVSLVLSVTAACGVGGGGEGKDSLVFVSYGKGAYQDGQQQAWLKSFEARTGTKIVIDGPSDNAKLKAMVKSGKVTWDVMDTDAFTARENCGTLFEKIDMGELANDFPPGTLSECGVPDAMFGLILMYNEKTYGDHPPTRLADFFDAKAFPGKRLIYSGDPGVGTLEAGLLADGVAPKDLYPLDVHRALGVYDRIKPDLTLAQTYGQQQQSMVGNQADMALVVSARAYSALAAGGTSWKPVWDRVPVTWDVLTIPKGSPHKKRAQELIKFASQPKQSAKFAALAGAGPANTAAKPALNKLQRQVDVFGEAHKNTQVVIDGQWWTENRATVVNAWTKWMTG
ncbi:extracellular solute-binding protein [Streptomyces sp. NPDC127074]|uniref:extracellular solute-binding protein n=1 Tax=Streptomyces sp. NPDC127074 TaxID=3347130 RepID=UPI00365CFF6B